MNCREAEETPGAVRQLMSRINIPAVLSDYGITAESFPVIIADARSPSMSKNPRNISDDDLAQILSRITS